MSPEAEIHIIALSELLETAAREEDTTGDWATRISQFNEATRVYLEAINASGLSYINIGLVELYQATRRIAQDKFENEQSIFDVRDGPFDLSSEEGIDAYLQIGKATTEPNRVGRQTYVPYHGVKILRLETETTTQRRKSIAEKIDVQPNKTKADIQKIQAHVNTTIKDFATRIRYTSTNRRLFPLNQQIPPTMNEITQILLEGVEVRRKRQLIDEQERALWIDLLDLISTRYGDLTAGEFNQLVLNYVKREKRAS